MSLMDIKMIQDQTWAFRIACFIDAQLVKGMAISLLIWEGMCFILKNCVAKFFRQIYTDMKSCKRKLSDPAVFNECLFFED